MKRLVVMGAVVGITVGIGGGAAWAAVGSAAPNPQHLTQQQLSRPAATMSVAAPVDTTTESKYTSIAPCRAVDTRIAGGPLYSGQTRTFTMTGTSSLAGQGGSATGCGVPSSASAVAATITTVASAKGYLKAWAFGAGAPATSFMNFTNTFNAATGGNIPLGSGRINVFVSGGPTQVVIDITGYYVPPMYAWVTSGGTLNASSRATGVTKLGTGTYQVDFDRNVSVCAYGANNFFYATGVLVEPRSGDANGVFVETVNSAGTLTDSYFYLTVTC